MQKFKEYRNAELQKDNNLIQKYGTYTDTAIRHYRNAEIYMRNKSIVHTIKTLRCYRWSCPDRRNRNCHDPHRRSAGRQGDRHQGPAAQPAAG